MKCTDPAGGRLACIIHMAWLPFALSVPGAAVAQAVRVAQSDAPVLDEVIVTARRREESLQRVPLSIAALSGEQLTARSVDSLLDLGQNTPNFTFAEHPNGGRLGGLAFIRGIGQRDSHPAYDSPVGIYLDGVYVGRMYANNIDMLEVERIEVLRGPQGTLFGKNTSGGAVSIVTRQPDVTDTFGRVELGTGSRSRFHAIGSLNVPLVTDRLGLQLSAAKNTQEGYGKRTDGVEMADINRQAARAQLLYQPTDGFSLQLSADWLDFDEQGSSYKLVDTNTGIAPIVAYNNAFDPDYDDRWLSPRDYSFGSTGPDSSRGEVWGGSLTATLERPWATLKSITAFRSMDVHEDLDPDGAPIVIVSKLEHSVQDQFSQELQATGDAADDRLAWTAGAYYFKEEIDNREDYELLPALFGGTRNFTRIVPVTNESTALYLQGTYKLSDELRLTAGLRYTRDEKLMRSTQLDFRQNVQFTTPDGQHSSSAWSPRLGLDYQLTPAVMLYASVAQGAKNGGFNGRVGRVSDFVEFDDEIVWTSELGLRSDLLDEQLRLNVTVFHSRYDDLQLLTAGTTVINGAPAPFSFISNIPEARVMGGEIEVVVKPAAGLSLAASLGLTDAEYRKLPTDARFIASRVITKDSKFSHVPAAQWALAAEYTRSLSDVLNVTGRIDYAHKDKVYFNPENTPLVTQPAFGLLNARLTFEHASTGISVSVFGTNLTDETYITGGFDDANSPSPGLGFTIVTQAAPREWGLNLQKRF